MELALFDDKGSIKISHRLLLACTILRSRLSISCLCQLAGAAWKANNISNGVGNRSEHPAQLQFPYQHSHFQQQHSTPASFPMSQAYRTSSSYPDQATAQQAWVPQPPYFGNLYRGSRTSPSGFANHQQQQQEQEQLQQLWAAQLGAAQYRTSANSTTPFPNWQNARQESPTQISLARPPIPTLSSLEAVGPKYAQISQQQLMTVTALPLAKGQKTRPPPLFCF
ncbi:hypothetical protein OIU76_006636 [Salix suchowensis]|nr:hypothetical protein OIU76_006636 [Salix suchowensis]